MAYHHCRKCALRAKYDRSPTSILGRLWRWHIRFCPGWKRYMASLTDEERSDLKNKYTLPGA